MEPINPELPAILLAAIIRILSLPESYESVYAYFETLHRAYQHIRAEKLYIYGSQPKCINDIIAIIDTAEMSKIDIADLNNLATRFLRYLIHEILSIEQINCLNIKRGELLPLLEHRLPIAPEYNNSEATDPACNASEQNIIELSKQQAANFAFAL